MKMLMMKRENKKRDSRGREDHKIGNVVRKCDFATYSTVRESVRECRLYNARGKTPKDTLCVCFCSVWAYCSF